MTAAARDAKPSIAKLERHSGIGYVYERLLDIKDDAERAMAEIDAAPAPVASAAPPATHPAIDWLDGADAAPATDTEALCARLKNTDRLPNASGEWYDLVSEAAAMIRSQQEQIRNAQAIEDQLRGDLEGTRKMVLAALDDSKAQARELAELRIALARGGL